MTSKTKSLASAYSLTVINCQSIRSKKASFENLILSHNPDFFVGTESWLSPEITNNEIFPSCYTVNRRDHPDGYGGVFLAAVIILSVHILIFKLLVK